MNKQEKIRKNGTVSRGIEWTNFTYNPLAGCQHGCRWTMPDGTVAVCYAETTAESVRRVGAGYENGFTGYYWRPDELEKPLSVKTPSKIFVGSMTDVFGAWVEDAHIRAILDVARRAHWHTFQFLTKNPRRVMQFIGSIPKNCWIGASTPPDHMHGHPLNLHKKKRMLSVTLAVLADIRRAGLITWLSAEPLSWDISGLLENEGYVPMPPVTAALAELQTAIDWMVVGAASSGRTYFPPSEEVFKNVMQVADRMGIAVFFKGNLRSLPLAASAWREEYPVE